MPQSPGFTLIELLVVLAILGVFVGFMLAMLNPFAQLEKSRDVQRQNDIKQLQTALDLFYNDNNCYPIGLSQLAPTPPVSAGVPIYIKKIPTDPEVANGVNYNYFSYPPSCPQWNVLFARLSRKSQTLTVCPLVKLEELQGQDCTPVNFDSEHDFCIISGEVNCDIISQYTLPVNITPPANQTSTPTPIVSPGAGTNTPTVTPIITPTLIPGGCYCANAVYGFPNNLPNPGPSDCNDVGIGGTYCNTSCTIACQ